MGGAANQTACLQQCGHLPVQLALPQERAIEMRGAQHDAVCEQTEEASET